jgi:hypothetical protein
VPKETINGSNERHQFAVEFLDRIAGAQILNFEYNPIGGGPTIADFDVRGLGDHLQHLKTQCP